MNRFQKSRAPLESYVPPKSKLETPEKRQLNIMNDYVFKFWNVNCLLPCEWYFPRQRIYHCVHTVMFAAYDCVLRYHLIVSILNENDGLNDGLNDCVIYIYIYIYISAFHILKRIYISASHNMTASRLSFIFYMMLFHWQCLSLDCV